MLDTFEEVVDFAIGEEECAADFYRSLASKMDRPLMRKVFEDFAAEEDGHKAKLLQVKAGNLQFAPTGKVLDLKIAEQLKKVDAFSAELDYQQALVLAMKKEKAAFLLYTRLADSTSHEGLQQVFLALAQEEAKHKLRFEIEYDEKVLEWN
jgi:rubrerythrin